MALRTGVSANTYEEYLIGPGAVYYNWQDKDNLGTCLGETKGGNVFEVIPTFHEYEPDGTYGHVEDHTRIAGLAVRLTANLYGVTAANILKTLAGSTSANYEILHIPAEYVGKMNKQTGGATTFDMLGSKSILSDTLRVYQDTAGATVAPVLVTKVGNYTWSGSDGTLIVASGGIVAEASVTVQYDYNSGTGGTMTVITQTQLATGDELSNIALIGEISDTAKTYDCMCIVYNALAMNGLTLTLPGGSREAAVMTVIFEGHWAANAVTLADAPYAIHYDAK